MEDHKSRIDRQWNEAMPRGWGNPKAFGRHRQERGDQDMHSGERMMLYDILDADENIKALVGGTYRAEGSTGASRGVAVATDHRVIFVDKGVLGSTEVSEMPYRRIEGITYSTGMMFGGVQILGMGATGWRIETVKPKGSAKLFADAVRGLVESHRAAAVQKETTQVSSPSVADELVKWSTLHKEGIITEEEFNTKKRQLLGFET
jgi:hypothetical protein